MPDLPSTLETAGPAPPHKSSPSPSPAPAPAPAPSASPLLDARISPPPPISTSVPDAAPAPHEPAPSAARTKPLTAIQTLSRSVRPPTTTTTTTPQAASGRTGAKRTEAFQFGTRYLGATDDVFAWNAWDHVDGTADARFVAYAREQYAFQRANRASEWDRRRFEAEPGRWWDRFYGVNGERFFKMRSWLRQEFEAL
ncbi:MAG: hypothetical protein LQ340_005607, partial [Diploschistes diacapsis]